MDDYLPKPPECPHCLREFWGKEAPCEDGRCSEVDVTLARMSELDGKHLLDGEGQRDG